MNPKPIAIPMIVAFPNADPLSAAVELAALPAKVEDGSSTVVGVAVVGGPVVGRVEVEAKRYPLIWTAHTCVAIELVVDQEPAGSD
jgi:hypothetical protein